LRTGVAGKSAVDLAREVMAQFGAFSALSGANQKTFCNMHGLGMAKYVLRRAVLEMAQRTLGDKLKQSVALSLPRAGRDLLRLRLHNRPRCSSECFPTRSTAHSERTTYSAAP